MLARMPTCAADLTFGNISEKCTGRDVQERADADRRPVALEDLLAAAQARVREHELRVPRVVQAAAAERIRAVRLRQVEERVAVADRAVRAGRHLVRHVEAEHPEFSRRAGGARACELDSARRTIRLVAAAARRLTVTDAAAPSMPRRRRDPSSPDEP